MLREDFVDQVAVNAFVLDGQLAGDEHADDRFAAATSGAARAVQDDVAAAGGGDVAAKLFQRLRGSGRIFARRRAHLNADGVARRLLAERLSAFVERSANCWEILLALAAMMICGSGQLHRGFKDAEKTAPKERAFSQKTAAIQDERN